MVPALAEAQAARIERMKRMGLNAAPAPVVIRPAPPTVANKVRQRCAGGFLWTNAEVDTLRDMAKAKFSARAIATKLRRSIGSVHGKARALSIVVYTRPSREFVTPLRGEEITQLYKLVVDQDRSSNARVRGIINLCASRHDVGSDDILGRAQCEALVKARQQAMWLAAKETSLSLTSLGKLFFRDHTTVIHAIRRENDRTGENVRGLGGRKKGLAKKRATA